MFSTPVPQGITRRATLRNAAVAVLSSSWIRTAQADESGTLTVALSNNPVTCDPINMSSHDSMFLSQTIWENLVEFDLTGTLRPQLAKALPDVSKDSLIYTFELRDDVLFQDGTQGNGEVNDFTREYATAALCSGLSPFLNLPARSVEERIAFVMSDGTEGILSPRMTLFARRPGAHRPDHAGEKRLSIGIVMTRPFLPEEIGRASQVEETAAAVRAAMRDAAITDHADVHYVQIKCPLLTAERVEAALARGNVTVTKSSYGSMAWSCGASSLAVAMALNEIPAPVADDSILRNWSLYSRVASASAGIELMRGVVIVFGNSVHATGRYVMGHGMKRDAIDLQGLLEAFASAGLVSRDRPMEVATG